MSSTTKTEATETKTTELSTDWDSLKKGDRVRIRVVRWARESFETHTVQTVTRRGGKVVSFTVGIQPSQHNDKFRREEWWNNGSPKVVYGRVTRDNRPTAGATKVAVGIVK